MVTGYEPIGTTFSESVLAENAAATVASPGYSRGREYFKALVDTSPNLRKLLSSNDDFAIYIGLGRWFKESVATVEFKAKITESFRAFATFLRDLYTDGDSFSSHFLEKHRALFEAAGYSPTYALSHQMNEAAKFVGYIAGRDKVLRENGHLDLAPARAEHAGDLQVLGQVIVAMTWPEQHQYFGDCAPPMDERTLSDMHTYIFGKMQQLAAKGGPKTALG